MLAVLADCLTVPIFWVQIYRSYIALGQYDVVQDEVKEDAQTALQAVKLLATFKSKPDMKDMVLMTLKEWLTDSSTGNNPTLQAVAVIAFELLVALLSSFLSSRPSPTATCCFP